MRMFDRYVQPDALLRLLESGRAKYMEDFDNALSDSIYLLFKDELMAETKFLAGKFFEFHQRSNPRKHPQLCEMDAMSDLDRICLSLDLGLKLGRNPTEDELDKKASYVGPVRSFLYNSLDLQISSTKH